MTQPKKSGGANRADEPHPLVVAAGERALRQDAGPNQAPPQTTPDKAADKVFETSERLTTFAGYLGTVIDDSQGATQKKWQLLYFDAKLSTGLIADADDIVVRNRMSDDTAAFGERDVIWVKADGPIRHGAAPSKLWLTGPFTRAGDFDAAPSGGTFARQGGPLGRTPECCGRATR